NYTILAPSRFGYFGSDILGNGTPKEQAKAYAELLDALNIQKAFVLSTSAGGSVAIRFALDYPERVKGLILYCSAMPPEKKPDKYINYAGPPKFMCNDYFMFLISPLFKSIMGMEPSLINGMLPISERRKGVVLDASVTNIDMLKNFDDYELERIEAPVLVLHAEDDRLADYDLAQESVKRIANCRFISFKTGGHLLMGHGDEVQNEVFTFVEHHKGG
ncbi:MAG: alpha/beta hydrolase, partial [Eubacteriales bacterium]|nr:alpha/beta hydrolase [Eubacteriales bacterium]